MQEIRLTEAGCEGRLWTIMIDGEPAPQGTTVQIPDAFAVEKKTDKRTTVTLNHAPVTKGTKVYRNDVLYAIAK